MFLPVGVFAQVTHTAHRLGEVVGREDEQELILRIATFIEALCGLTVVGAFLPQFFFQFVDLAAGDSDLVIYLAHFLVE